MSALKLAAFIARGALHDMPALGLLGPTTNVATKVSRKAFCAAAATPAPPPPPPPSSNRFFVWAAALGVAGAGVAAYTLYDGVPSPLAPGPVIEPAKGPARPAFSKPGDYDAVRKSLETVLDNDSYEDGSYGPLVVRLAWHASGTWDAKTKTGGSNGATMRFSPESNHGANNGLQIARDLLDKVKTEHPWISYADLWTLAGAKAIEHMGGPVVPWHSGRTDKLNGDTAAPDGRLPNATLGAQHIRDIFYRMGFDDQEIVALSGAHTLGRCHTDRSGFTGPWTNAPTTFSNLYFTELTENKWTKKKWDGPVQYEDKSGTLMMLPTDMALLSDRKFRKWTDLYAKDQDKFFEDFARAFGRMLAFGVPEPAAA